ncbi:MAG: hypothetical protein ACI8PP_001822 [Candidatus Pseudothioglobus sp.]|jgi:hypothetical protein
MIPFAPASAIINAGFKTKNFKVRPLTVNDLVKDYDAVMSSVGHLNAVFDPNDTWPTADLTLEQDLIDLGWHQKEFQNRSSFTYTVMNPDESTCLGCVYIYPSQKAHYDASVFLWIRQSHSALLDDQLLLDVKTWIDAHWWFTSVAYPGRQPTWEQWELLPPSQ